jgi:hypothetical protein
VLFVTVLRAQSEQLVKKFPVWRHFRGYASPALAVTTSFCLRATQNNTTIRHVMGVQLSTAAEAVLERNCVAFVRTVFEECKGAELNLSGQCLGNLEAKAIAKELEVPFSGCFSLACSLCSLCWLWLCCARKARNPKQLSVWRHFCGYPLPLVTQPRFCCVPNQKNQTLQVLNLYGNDIRDAGAVALAGAIKVSSTCFLFRFLSYHPSPSR